MKKKQLKLDVLKLNSFVTDMVKPKMNTVKGGSPTDLCMSNGSCQWSFDCPDGPEYQPFSDGPAC